MNHHITVYKLNPQRGVTWHYPGTLLREKGHCVLIEAFFDREDRPFHGMLLARGDRFLEFYSGEEWFNIYEIHDRNHDQVKGWYGNVTMPAEFAEDSIRYVDLALDLLVFPDGNKLVLDEDEFAGLEINNHLRESARKGLTLLQEIFVDPRGFSLENYWRQEKHPG